MVCVSTVVECGRLTVVRSVVLVSVTWAGVVLWVLTLMQPDMTRGAPIATKQISIIFMWVAYNNTDWFSMGCNPTSSNDVNGDFNPLQFLV